MWPQAYFRGEIEAHQRRDPGLHVQRDACTEAWPKVSVSIMPKMTQDDQIIPMGSNTPTHTYMIICIYIHIWSNGIWIYDIYIYIQLYMDMVRVLEFHLEMILFFGICIANGPNDNPQRFLLQRSSRVGFSASLDRCPKRPQTVGNLGVLAVDIDWWDVDDSLGIAHGLPSAPGGSNKKKCALLSSQLEPSRLLGQMTFGSKCCIMISCSAIILDHWLAVRQGLETLSEDSNWFPLWEETEAACRKASLWKQK